MTLGDVKALTFDVFGTVVDWRSSIIEAGERLGGAKGIAIDWGAFADSWRRKYNPAMDRVRRGELPWTKLDGLHRLMLDEVLAEFQIRSLSEQEKDALNHTWHRLRPWPDAVAGLTRLRRRYVIATLSNGNLSLLVDMAKHAGLPWDCILSAELAKAYKPDAAVYQKAIELLSLQPRQVLMVAAHAQDLHAAQQQGMQTALVPRPLEWGSATAPASNADGPFDLVVDDLNGLAERLQEKT